MNPELELLRFLSAKGFPHIAPLAGWYEVEGRLLDATLGILQEYLAGARDGWELALDELASDPDGLLDRLGALGTVIGELHSALGSDASDPGLLARRAVRGGALDPHRRRRRADRARVPATCPRPTRSRRSAAAARTCARGSTASRTSIAGGRVIRTHGDLHLGQTMLTERGWVVLDFEGEPARPLPERRLKRSPLARRGGHAALVLLRARRGEPDTRNGSPRRLGGAGARALPHGYHEAVDSTLLPPGQQAIEQLLAVFELEKAVYELRYELNNRPDWVGIPVAGILRLLEDG